MNYTIRQTSSKSKSTREIRKNLKFTPFTHIELNTKYHNDLLKIKENIRFNKRKKEFERKMTLMKKKKAAVRIIEKYWLKVLERREEMDLEEILKKIPEECRDLYKKLTKSNNEYNNICFYHYINSFQNEEEKNPDLDLEKITFEKKNDPKIN